MKALLLIVVLAFSVSNLYAQDEKVNELVKKGMLVYLKNKSHLTDALNADPDVVEITHVTFKPNDYAEEYIMVQVKVFKNGNISDGFGVLYKDAEGNYDFNNYSIIEKDDHPCENCNLEDIKTEKDTDAVAVMMNRKNNGYFEKKIGYNLQEAYFYFFD